MLPKVSVAMIAYNHERFVAQALESVLAQRVDFPLEIVFGEDCSTDNTRQIVRDMAEKHAGRFNLLLPEKNLGMNRNLAATIKACRGQYVALLEGDDYWIDPEKLQLQVNYLDSHPDCSICFTRAAVIDDGDQPVDTPSVIRELKPVYSLKDYLARSFQPRTCTVMFRNRLFEDFPEWFYRLPVGDFPLHVLNAQRGDFGFLDRVTSTYRIHAGGVWSLGFTPTQWTSSTREQNLRNAARMQDLINLYETVGAYLGSEFKEVTREQVALFSHLLTVAYRLLGDWPKMRESVRKQLRTLPIPRQVPLSAVLSDLVISHLPFLARRTQSRLAN
jgi:glycosyltransferase involved in cell wall biosynthesis